MGKKYIYMSCLVVISMIFLQVNTKERSLEQLLNDTPISDAEEITIITEKQTTSDWHCWGPDLPEYAACRYYLRSVSMISDSDGWAISGFHPNSRILHWDGVQWTVEFETIGINLYALKMISSLNGWAVGWGQNGAVILHWDGSQWIGENFPGMDDGLLSIDMEATSDGWAVGGNWALHWDGIQWETNQLPDNACLRAVSISSLNDVWAGGCSGQIWHWDGIGWNMITSLFYDQINSIDMVNALDGWAVSDGNYPISRWNGVSWEIYPFSGAYLKSIKMISSTDGWAAGNDGNGNGVLIHWDGLTWTFMDFPDLNILNAIDFSSPDDGWTIGSAGTVLHWNGIEWSIMTNPSSNILNSISMISSTDGWAVGRGTILHWDGNYWWEIPCPLEYYELFSVSMLSPTDVWAVGVDSSIEQGVILHWNGNSWSHIAIPTTLELTSIEMISSNDGWVIGKSIFPLYDNVLLRWNGTNWLEVESIPGVALSEIDMISSTEGWAAGVDVSSQVYGVIAHWDGTSWIEYERFFYSHELGAISMTSPSEGWAVGLNNLYHWDGSSWTDFNIINHMLSVSSINETNAWFVGDSGYIYHWNGIEINQIPSNATQHLFDIDMVSETEGWAVGVDGLIIRYISTNGTPTDPFNGILEPVWPVTNTEPVDVMQGGIAYRHYQLLDSEGDPLPGASITFSQGEESISDAMGYFTYTVETTSLGNPGSYIIFPQSVIINGTPYDASSQSAFYVSVTERRFSNTWSAGASSRSKGGLSFGMGAYLQKTNTGGIELKLEESNPNVIHDDVVIMKEFYDNEYGVGASIGLPGKVNILGLRIGSEATSELALRGLGRTNVLFNSPYIQEERIAQSAFILASVMDSLNNAITDAPNVLALLRSLEILDSPYRDYINEYSSGFGSKITPLQANVGADLSLGLVDGSDSWNWRLAKFNLLDVNTSIQTLQDFTIYTYPGQNEIGLGIEAELDLDLSALSWEIIGIKNKLLGVLEENAKKIRIEIILDANSLDINRLEVSLTGEGNPNSYSDVSVEEVNIKATIPAEELTWENINQTVNVIRLVKAAKQMEFDPYTISQSAMISELSLLLSPIDQFSYEVIVEDGATLSNEISLGLSQGLYIELGIGLPVKKVRSMEWEQGVFLDGHPHMTAKYEADALVSHPGKSWYDLTLNALSSLWDEVKSFFEWNWQKVLPGTGWILNIISHDSSGVVYGGATIEVSPGTFLYNRERDNVQQDLPQLTVPITVTAMSWVPEVLFGNDNQFNGTATMASGSEFVIGGIYEFSPYTVTLNIDSTLMITYTDSALSGIDESKIGVFMWQAEESNWQPIISNADFPNNTFTASISQLGTYALGYDVTPPYITLISPVDSSVIQNIYPTISALVSDKGVGIKSDTVEIWLDGVKVSALYVPGTAELSYQTLSPMSNGIHTVTINASDVMMNSASQSYTFTVDTINKIYLPSVLR